MDRFMMAAMLAPSVCNARAGIRGPPSADKSPLKILEFHRFKDCRKDPQLMRIPAVHSPAFFSTLAYPSNSH
jgi:hypothetical protein